MSSRIFVGTDWPRFASISNPNPNPLVQMIGPGFLQPLPRSGLVCMPAALQPVAMRAMILCPRSLENMML
eukprot:scaffold137752_cov65-Attheya_sp.AAC.1